MSGQSPRSIGRGIALVTGASSGIGLSVSLELARRGWTVWAGVRRPESFDDVRAAAKGAGLDARQVEPVDLDVTSEGRITATVDEITAAHGRGPDLLVANAGLGAAGFVEEMGLDTWRRIIETNTVGVVACVRAVLPSMRRNTRGHVVIIGSNAANVPQPAFAPYAATKWAVEGFAETLAMEVAPFGIDVTVVQPGAILTGFAERTTYELPDGPYSAFMPRLQFGWDYLQKHAIESTRVARGIADLVERRRPPLRLRIGRDSKVAGALRHLLPGRMRVALARKLYHLPGRGAIGSLVDTTVPSPTQQSADSARR